MNVDSISKWLMEKRRWLGIGALLAVVIIVSGAANVGLDNHFSIFFDGGDRELQAYEASQSKYTRTDNIFVALAPKNNTVFEKGFIEKLKAFTDAAWKAPYAKRVDSIANFQHVSARDGEISVASLFSSDPSKWDMADAKEKTLAESELVHLLIDAEGTTTAVNILLDLPKDAEAPGKVVNYMRTLSAEHFDSSVEVHIHGIAALNHAFMEATEQDSATLMPLMFALIFAMLGICLRSFMQTGVIIAVVHLGVAIVVGVIGWLSFNINMVNIVAMTIVLTLAVADCVHILVTYRRALSSGIEKLAALEQAIRINLMPLFITSATTSVGFLALIFSDSPPIRELGIVTAVSVMGVFALSITFFVWLVAALPVKQNHALNTQTDSDENRVVEWIIAKHRAIFFGFLVFAPILFYGVGLNHVNDHASHYFDDNAEFAKSTDFITNHLSGLDVLSFSLDSGKPRGINNVDYLEKVDSFSTWLRSQPEVTHVKSYADTVKRMNKYVHGGDPASYQLPDSNEVAAQFLLLYSMSTTFGLGIEDRVSFDRSATQVVTTLKINDPKQLLDLDHRAHRWLTLNAPELVTHGTSVPKLFAKIGINNIQSMLWGNLAAIIVIGALLALSFRSIRYGLLSLIPNLFPALIAIGFWGYINGHVNLAVAIVFSITLGIIVDDTVHFLHKFLHAYRQGSTVEGSVRYAYATVGKAIIVTTVSLCAGFIVLSASSFAVNSFMGVLVSLTLGVALLIDLLVLPSLLLLFGAKQSTLNSERLQGSDAV